MIHLKNKAERQAIIDSIDITSNKSSNLSLTTQNSFLIEIENNFDIDQSIRSEINKRFHRSLVNATYRFPRTQYSPFPIISLHQKHSQREAIKAAHKKTIKNIRLVSHTPKPSLNQSLHISKKPKKRVQEDRKILSITPTPVSFGKKKMYDFPKIKLNKSPYLSKN